MPCDLLDIRCILVSELVGSAFLTVIFGIIFYFIIASKNNFGFDTTIAFAFPLLLIVGIAFTGFSAIMAFSTIVVGFMLAKIFSKLVPNR